MQSDPTTNIAYYETLADVYRLFFPDLDKNMEQEGAWLDAVLQTYGAKRILDASCGTGRQAVPLAERGYEVIGADPSPAMLRQARAIAKRHHTRARFVQTAFVDLPRAVGSDFDAVIALGNGLCNLEHREDILAALRAIRLCCRPDGICVIGIKDFDRLCLRRQRFHGHGIEDKNGVRTILFEIWDFADPILVVTAFAMEGVWDQEIGRHVDWRTRSAQTREYMAGSREVQALAREAGFSSVRRLEHRSEAVYAFRP
jgi:SAM-dependent methyltransferase